MSGTGDEWQNPIADSTAFEVEPTPPQHSMLSAITLNQGQLSEDDLVDLTYAFQAADMSKEGKLNFEEFQFMLDVMGCDLEADRARQLMADAKADFAAWLRTTDDNTRTECKKIWDAYDKDKNGVLDTDEINAIIVALQNQGFTPKALAKREQETDWEFEQFCACVYPFLAHAFSALIAIATSLNVQMVYAFGTGALVHHTNDLATQLALWVCDGMFVQLVRRGRQPE